MTFLRGLRTNPFLLALGLAIAVHLLVIGASFWREAYTEETADEARYVFYGESIRAGRGMHAPGYEDKPTAYVMPGLPLLFAAVGTESLVRLRITQLILSALVALLTFYLADRLFPKTDIGFHPVPLRGRLGRWLAFLPSPNGEGSGVRLNVKWLATIFLLANLAWILQPLYLLTEPLFTLFLLLGVGAIALKPTDWRYLVAAGFALGLAWLTRGALFGVLPLIFLYLWWRVGFAKLLLVGLVMGLTISAWVIRNYYAFDAFVPTSTQSGQVIAGAYNDTVYANPWGEGWVNPDELYRDQISPDLFNDELAYSDYLTKQGITWIKDNPGKLPKLMLSHVFHYLRPYPKITRNPIELVYEVASWGIGGVLLIYGVWCGWKNRDEWLLVFGLVILGGFLTGLMFYATPRFRIPYAPYFALIEAYAAWHLWLKLKAES